MIIQALIASFAVFAGMALSYVFHFFMTRLLAPALYGELAVIIGILTVLLVPTSSIQTLLAREIAKLDKEHEGGIVIGLVKKYSKTIFLSSLAVGVVLLPSSYLIAQIFNDTQLILPIQIIALGVPLAFLTPVVRAYYQGRERIWSLSGIMVGEPFLKVISAVALVLLGFGLLGATFSLLVGSLLPVSLIFPIILKKGKPLNYSLNLNKSFLLILPTSILIMLFLYLDLFFVRYYLGSDQAGYYNVASITSRVLFYAVGGVTLVFLPKSSKLSIYKDRRELKVLLTKSVLLLIPIFAIFILFPTQIISIFYTEKYLVALTPFIVLSVGMFALGIFQILLNFLWSQGMEKLPLTLSAIVVFIDVLLLNHLTPALGLMGASIATTSSAILFLIPSSFVTISYLRK